MIVMATVIVLHFLRRGDVTALMLAGPWTSERSAGHTSCYEESGNVVLGSFHVSVGHLPFFTCSTTSAHVIKTLTQV